MLGFVRNMKIFCREARSGDILVIEAGIFFTETSQTTFWKIHGRHKTKFDTNLTPLCHICQ